MGDERGQRISRRRMLELVGTGGAIGIAGCGQQQSNQTTSPTPTSTETSTPIDTPTTTAADDQAPTILRYEATPQQNGTTLYVVMEGEDDRGLAEARIAYGDRELAWQPDGKQVTIDGQLEDTAAMSPDNGRVVYVLTDAAGNEARKYAEPDDEAPGLTVKTRPTDTAGQVVAVITAQDDTGLAEVHTLLNGETLQNRYLHGSADYTDERTFTVPDGQRGRNVPVGARAQDWNGNTTENDIESYVRKYDVMEDTRLNVGAIYQPDFPWIRADCWNGRDPAVGIHDDGYPSWVFDRHIDQLTGFGVKRVMLEYNGNEDIANETERFLASDLADTIQIEPFYAISRWFWSENATEPNENLREDVLKPHMDWIRETILGRDNTSTFEGRPVMQIWAAHNLKDDYEYSRIRDEWGGYDSFVDDMRSLLEIDGKEPFIVAETYFGYNDFRLKRKRELAKAFDGLTTWVAGGAWRLNEPHNFTDQEGALEYVEQSFQNNRNFVDNHDMEFVPTTFPGFNERGCPEEKPAKRKTPRSPELFRRTLELADEYRTTEMVNIAPYNNWTEGTQIEPGTFRGNDYGTEYLDVVKKFQSSSSQ